METITVQNLQERFGERVAHIVDGCTKIKANMATAKRRELTYNKLFTLAGENIEVFIVKLADRLHNMRTLEHLAANKRQRTARETIDYYAPIAARFGMYPLKRELMDLALKYLFPRQSQKSLKRMQKSDIFSDGNKIQKKLSDAFTDFTIDVSVRLRKKGLYSQYDPERKRLLQNFTENEMDVVIVCLSADIMPCYHALGVSNRLYHPIPKTIRDFIANPKSNGYRSLHVRINHNNRNYLLKIRTEAMDLHARYGILTYYKSGKEAALSDPWQDVAGALRRIGQYDHGEARRKEILKDAEEISTCTPRGKTIYLPKESIVLDFAYHIHSDLGDHCTGATIHPRSVPVRSSEPLEDGDIVNILSSAEPLDILDKTIEDRCRSDRARIAIKNRIAGQRKNFARALGEKLIRNTMTSEGFSLEEVSPKILNQILVVLNMVDSDELYTKVGLGKYSSRIIIFYMKNILGNRKDERSEPENTQIIEVRRLNPTLFKFSNCCNPYPGEKSIVGILTEKGVSLHLPGCDQLDRYNVKQEDKFMMKWGDAALNQRINAFLSLPKVQNFMETMEILNEWVKETDSWGFKCHATLNRKTTKITVSHKTLSVVHLTRLLSQFPRSSFHWKLTWSPLAKFGAFAPRLPADKEFALFQQNQ